MMGSSVVLYAALVVTLQIVVSRVSLLADAASNEVHVHDDEHDGHDHSAHAHAHAHDGEKKKAGKQDATGVAKALSADEEAKLKNSGEKHTCEISLFFLLVFHFFFTFFST
jgi:ABC-type nickel/cobalt efflux system permease component RcnA